MRSPLLRFLACFAWLMLVALPIHAESLGMNSGMQTTGKSMSDAADHTSMSPSMVMTQASGHGHAAHAASTNVPMNADDCCGGRDHGSAATCHCAATFGMALVAVGVVNLSPMMAGNEHTMPQEIFAPDIADGPPLRPPTL